MPEHGPQQVVLFGEVEELVGGWSLSEGGGSLGLGVEVS